MRRAERVRSWSCRRSASSPALVHARPSPIPLQPIPPPRSDPLGGTYLYPPESLHHPPPKFGPLPRQSSQSAHENHPTFSMKD
eukprot:750386-Hanusia_phi.AAC.5